MNDVNLDHIESIIETVNELIKENRELRSHNRFRVYLSSEQIEKIMHYLNNKDIAHFHNNNNHLKDAILAWIQETVNERIDLL